MQIMPVMSRDQNRAMPSIISAPRNWEISVSPYRSAQHADPVNGSGYPNSAPARLDWLSGMADMDCTPPAITRSEVPDITAWAA